MPIMNCRQATPRIIALELTRSIDVEEAIERFGLTTLAFYESSAYKSFQPHWVITKDGVSYDGYPGWYMVKTSIEPYFQLCQPDYFKDHFEEIKRV